MMDYEVFKDVVTEKFLSYMPEKYQDMEVKVDPVEKVNRKQDGLSLRKAGTKEKVFPTIYINDIYENYLSSGDPQETLKNAAEAMDKAYMQTPQVPSLDTATIMDNVVFELVNTIQNEDLLRRMPHREFQDLSVVYRWVIHADEEAISRAFIDHDIAERMGISEEQLFKAAAENTRRILPPVIKSMTEVMRESFIKDGMPPQMVNLMMGEIPPRETMWIITNQCGIDGAASMLYEDQLHEVAERMENDLYILPSSIHEVIAVSAEMGEPEELAQMVADVNMNTVRPNERLSNQVYHYDRDLRKLTLATDTPNKRLDGIVAEKKPVYEIKQSR